MDHGRVGADLVDVAHEGDHLAIRIGAINVVVTHDAAFDEVVAAFFGQFRINVRHYILDLGVQPPGRLQAGKLMLQLTQVADVHRGGEMHQLLLVGGFAEQIALPGQLGGQTALFRQMPVEGAEYADDLAGIASQRADAGVGGNAVPLHVVMLRNIPEERIADRGIGVVVDAVAEGPDDFPQGAERVAAVVAQGLVGAQDDGFAVTGGQQGLRALDDLPDLLRLQVGDFGDLRRQLIAGLQVFDHPVENAPKGVQAGGAVLHANAVIAFFVGRQAAVDGVVHGDAQRIAVDVPGDCFGVGVVAVAVQHALDEARAFFLVDRIGFGLVFGNGAQGLLQAVEEGRHVGHGGAAVDAHGHVTAVRLFYVDLVGVAGGAGEADIVTLPIAEALIRVLYETQGQSVRIAVGGFLHQVAVTVYVLRIQEPDFGIGLLQRQGEIVGNEIGALGGVVEEQALFRTPVLVRVDHLGEGVAHGIGLLHTRDGGAPIRVIVPVLQL